ncbi:MAG: transposase [Rubrivivax sp.]|nr:transposase [Rubrivivax sp.]
MARPLRIEYSGAVYHITSRGNARKKIYSDDQDRENFLGVLGEVVRKYHWLCHAYCLMDNHYHLLVDTPDANLSIGMRQLNGVYTQLYSRRHRRPGHIFQGRYKAILVDKDNYLLELSRYVVLNPVRARCAKLPEHWKWGSYAATAGLKKVPEYLSVDWIHGVFGTDRKTAQRQYRKFVKEGINRKSPWGELQGQILLGEDSFVERFRSLLGDREAIKEIPRRQRYAGKPSLKDIFKNKSSGGKRGRNQGIYDAHMRCGYTLKEIADYLGIHYTTVSKVVKDIIYKM